MSLIMEGYLTSNTQIKLYEHISKYIQNWPGYRFNSSMKSETLPLYPYFIGGGVLKPSFLRHDTDKIFITGR